MRPVVLLLATLLVAGCFGGDPEPAERRFSASAGKASMGWAYGGEGVVAASGTLDGLVNDPDNTGLVNVSFDFAGSHWVVTFDRFTQAEGRDFQDGGVAFSLDEHGDTGVADASIPRIHAIVAAWGSARVERDGALVTPEPWSAHLMVSRDTVRGADGKITKADGTTPYDPAAPGDARRIENDAQALFFIKHPQGETYERPPVEVGASLSCAQPQCSIIQELALEEGASTLELNVSVSGPGAGLPFGAIGQGRLALVDANATELGAVDVALSPAAGAPASFGVVDLAGAAFPLSLVLTGDGVFTVDATGVAAYDDVPFIVITWDDVTVA